MRLVLVSNRLPNPAEQSGNEGGLLTAVRSALPDEPFLWIGWNGRTSDEDPSTPTRREHHGVSYVSFPLRHNDIERYYAGYANRVLWPLFHQSPARLCYRKEDEEGYLRVNEIFAHLTAPLLHPGDVLWVHDYHLIPLAKALRALGVRHPIGFFLHIPFPPHGALRVLPGHRRLLAGFLDYDLVGFQTADDEEAFRDAVRHEFAGGPAPPRTGVFPASIDPAECTRAAARGRRGTHGRRLLQSLTGRRLILGVDRLDYSKGLPERLRAYERLLETQPRWHRSIVFFQIAPLSRSEIPEYADLRAELDGIVGRILGRFADYDWLPIRYMTRGFRRDTVLGFLSLARVGLVTPLRDGMNLVAKEHVAAQPEEDPGVLVLSEFAGAAHELTGALVVNPYDPEGVAEALDRALAMPLEERRERHASNLRAIVSADARAWARAFLAELGGVPRQGSPPNPA